MSFLNSKNKPLKAALYIRVSTDMQADKDSLPLQKSDLQKLAELNGITDYVIFEDAGFSGKNFNRPKFQEMIQRVRQGEFTHIFVWKLDRISRNLMDFLKLYEELSKLKVAFISKNETFDTSSAGGEAMLKILLIFAEMERKTISERVTAVMLNRAKENKWNGGRYPFGYMQGPEIVDNATGKKSKTWPVPDPITAPLAVNIFQLYKSYKSLRKVAQILNDTGVRPSCSKYWSTVGIHKILTNKFYYGVYTYNRINVNEVDRKYLYRDESEWISVCGCHEALVTKELWDECNEILKNNRHYKPAIGSKVGAQEKYIFGGLLKCATCGYGLTSRDRKNIPNERQSTYYYCSNYPANNLTGCKNRGYASDRILLPIILRLISRIIDSCEHANRFKSVDMLVQYILYDNLIPGAAGIAEADKLFIAVRSHARHDYGVNADPLDPNALLIDSAKKELEKHERAIKRLESIYLYEDGDMSESDFFNKKKDIEKSIADIKNQIESLSYNNNSDTAYLANLSQLIMIKKLQDTNGDFDYYRLVTVIGRKTIRDFIKLIISKISIGKKNRIHKITFKNGMSLSFIY